VAWGWWILDIGCRILDAGYKIHDASAWPPTGSPANRPTGKLVNRPIRYWILDVRYGYMMGAISSIHYPLSNI
jgi:hypothetical protein